MRYWIRLRTELWYWSLTSFRLCLKTRLQSLKGQSKTCSWRFQPSNDNFELIQLIKKFLFMISTTSVAEKTIWKLSGFEIQACISSWSIISSSSSVKGLISGVLVVVDVITQAAFGSIRRSFLTSFSEDFQQKPIYKNLTIKSSCGGHFNQSEWTFAYSFMAKISKWGVVRSIGRIHH